MNWKNANVLVTGGTGFVGSHLIQQLVNLGAHVVTTNLFYSPQSYFAQEKLDTKVTVAHIDIVDFDAVYDLITSTQPDYIFHLAAQALVDVAYDNPRRTLDSNIMGTVNILDSARLYGKVKGIVVASSDKAYGKTKKTKYKESDPLVGDHPYEVSKSAMDLISYSYFKTYNVPVTIARFGNIYGEGDLNESRIIPGIMKALHQHQPLHLRSNGTFVRDYLHVKDVVEGYLLLARHIQKTKGEAYNFGSSETLTVLDTIKAIETALHKQIVYKIQDRAKNEIPYQSLDYHKIRALGWQPRNTIAHTATDMYEWYQKIWSQPTKK